MNSNQDTFIIHLKVQTIIVNIKNILILLIGKH